MFWGADDVRFASGNREDLLLHKLQPGAPAVLWRSVGVFLPQSDVSADGQRFLFTRAVGSGSAEAPLDRIVIVQNFFAELKAKVR